MGILRLNRDSFERQFIHEAAQSIPKFYNSGHIPRVVDISYPKDGILKDYDMIEVIDQNWLGDEELKVKVLFSVFYKKVPYDDLYVRLRPDWILVEQAKKIMSEDPILDKTYLTKND